MRNYYIRSLKIEKIKLLRNSIIHFFFEAEEICDNYDFNFQNELDYNLSLSIPKTKWSSQRN